MTPKQFAALAVAAVVSAAVAIAVYSSSVQWSNVTESGEALVAGLPDRAKTIAEIEVDQGDQKITLERQGKDWVLAEHDSYAADPKKVDALLAGLSKAQLVEAKTRMKDKYPLLGVEDPDTKDAKSVLVRLLDDKGKEVTSVIIGNKRQDTLGIGGSGTYVRKPGNAQAWLANADIEAGVKLTDWVDPQLFETPSPEVEHLTVDIPGEQPLEIIRDKGGPGHTLSEIPDGMKLKYTNIVDEIVRAASTFTFNDVRKFQAPPDDAKISTVVMTTKGGVHATFHIREDSDNADDAWVTVEATGDGGAKKIADALNERAKGWEFRVPESRIKEILKRRKDLLEAVSS
jgi:hypothetical protein